MVCVCVCDVLGHAYVELKLAESERRQAAEDTAQKLRIIGGEERRFLRGDWRVCAVIHEGVCFTEGVWRGIRAYIFIPVAAEVFVLHDALEHVGHSLKAPADHRAAETPTSTGSSTSTSSRRKGFRTKD